MVNRLLILSESFSKKKDPEIAIVALERYTGVYFKIIKKLLREKQIKNLDIIIVSQKYGIIKSSQKIPYYEFDSIPQTGFGRKLILTNEEVETNRRNNIQSMNKIFKNKKYDEIIICMGKPYFRLIQGFDSTLDTQIIHIQGKGPGPKAQNLSNYFKNKSI